MAEHVKGQVVGYARVSSTDQNLDRQLEALGQVDRLFAEKTSGKNVTGRPQLQELLAYVREGDVVRVKSADRLARSTRDLLALVEQLKERRVAVEFLDTPSLNTDTPHGAFMLTILGAVAELERLVIKERQSDGIALAKKRGVYARMPKLTAEQLDDARARIAAGIPKAAIARSLGCSRATLYNALAGKGRYAADGH